MDRLDGRDITTGDLQRLDYPGKDHPPTIEESKEGSRVFDLCVAEVQQSTVVEVLTNDGLAGLPLNCLNRHGWSIEYGAVTIH